MSPEQIVGDTVDVRTDLFSLGVVAYELVTGKKPFENEKLFLLLEEIVKNDPIPVSTAAPDAPPLLAAIVERTMRKNPAERFASAGELKAALEAVRDALAGVSPAAPKAGARAAGTILVVDDDARVREGVASLLGADGYSVDAAADGAEGLEKLRRPGVCLVLLDLAMPGIDGWQFLERVGGKSGAPPVPVVLLSGLQFIHDAPGVADFIRKPIEPGRLLDCVRRFCGEPEITARAAG